MSFAVPAWDSDSSDEGEDVLLAEPSALRASVERAALRELSRSSTERWVRHKAKGPEARTAAPLYPRAPSTFAPPPKGGVDYGELSRRLAEAWTMIEVTMGEADNHLSIQREGLEAEKRRQQKAMDEKEAALKLKVEEERKRREKLEAERKAKEELKRQKEEKERKERERVEKERQEKERLEREKQERERKAKEAEAKAKAEAEAAAARKAKADADAAAAAAAAAAAPPPLPALPPATSSSLFPSSGTSTTATASTAPATGAAANAFTFSNRIKHNFHMDELLKQMAADPALKAIEAELVPIITQISASVKSVKESIKKLIQTVGKYRVAPPPLPGSEPDQQAKYAYHAFRTISKKAIVQDGRVKYAVTTVLRHLALVYPEAGDIFQHTVYSNCKIAAPGGLQPSDAEDGFKSLGRKTPKNSTTVEPVSLLADRLRLRISLYGAALQTPVVAELLPPGTKPAPDSEQKRNPLNLTTAWRWFAGFLNVKEPVHAAFQTILLACLHGMMETTCWGMLQQYGYQFGKILLTVEQSILPSYTQRKSADQAEQQFADSSHTNVLDLLNKAKSGAIPVPEGRDLKWHGDK